MERNEKGQFVKGRMHSDLIGQRYGRLTVIERDLSRESRRAYWLCRCDCGNYKSIRGDGLGRVQSCGCLKKEQDIKNLGIKNNHNKTHHPAFSIWNAMMNRCNNPNQRAYSDYGGRGIIVCDEWKDVTTFCEWMDDNGFKKGLSIERIDVNGNYCPDNCELIPKSHQTWNTRKTTYIQIGGDKIPLAKTARKLGLNPCLVWHRWKSGEREYGRLFYKGNLRTECKG